MKTYRGILTIAALLVLLLPVAGQENLTLTKQQKADYDAQKLTIMGSVLVNSQTGQTVSSDGMAPDSKGWSAIMGYKRINEPEFLRAVGMIEEAKKSEQNLQAKNWMTIGGISGMVIGLGLEIVTAVIKDDYGTPIMLTSEGIPWLIGGGVALVGGGVFMTIGFTKPSDITPLGRASSLADDYNLQLAIKIAGK